MVVRWGAFSTKSRKALKTGWLVAAGLAALYLAVSQPHNQERGIAMQKASGLASVNGGTGWEPISLWHQTSILPNFARTSLQKGIVGGVPEDRAAVLSASLIASPGTSSGGEQEAASPDRKLVRTASLGLIVKAPAQTAEQITQLAQRAGGFWSPRMSTEARTPPALRSPSACPRRSSTMCASRSASLVCAWKMKASKRRTSPGNTLTRKRACATCAPRNSSI